MFLSLLLATQCLWSADFDAYQGHYTRAEVEKKLETYLEKESNAEKFYRLSDESLEVGDLEKGEIDYTLRLSLEPNEARPPRSKKGLQGARIALDPGHLGGAYAKMEDRYIELTETGQMIDEGTLTYRTAMALKPLLEAEGAVVMVTRAGVGKGALEKNFFDWIQERPDLWNSKEPLSKLFRTTYNREDLVARAEAINAFNPDMTLMIHFNASGDNEITELSDVNYSLVFTPGGFCKGELSKPQDRYEFLRLLVTDHMEESVKLSDHVLHHLTTQLHVPAMEEVDESFDLGKVSIFLKSGVCARNLALTRLVHGPLCYAETLIQNNKEEFYKLLNGDERVQQSARAYFEGIKDYFNE